MPEKKTISAKRPNKNSALNYFLSGTLIVVLACAAGLTWFIFNKETERRQQQAAQARKEQEAARIALENAAPRTIINDSIKETVRAAALKGWKPCPNKDCLTLAKAPWTHKDVPGHDPSDYWHEVRGWGAFNQNHVGHIIKYHADHTVNDLGACPTCNGTGWVRKDFVY